MEAISVRYASPVAAVRHGRRLWCVSQSFHCDRIGRAFGREPDPSSSGCYRRLSTQKRISSDKFPILVAPQANDLQPQIGE